MTTMKAKRSTAVRHVTRPVTAPLPSPAPLPGKPMTKAERDDLQRLIRRREGVLKSAAEQRKPSFGAGTRTEGPGSRPVVEVSLNLAAVPNFPIWQPAAIFFALGQRWPMRG
jgi:hypothetical protein